MSEKNMISLFDKFRYRNDLFNVFADFLESSAIAISNTVDKFHYRSREDRYLQIMKKYTREEVYLFPQILAELINSLEQEKTDALGSLYMSLELSNKWQGQFFTPMSVCNMMAEMTISGNDIEKIIEERGYFTLNEPAAGGGATVIGIANALEKRGYNYQEVMRVTAQDIDKKSVHMSYLQFSLLGIDAVLMRGDTLSYKFDADRWRTPNNILKWSYWPQDIPEDEQVVEPAKYEQLALF